MVVAMVFLLCSVQDYRANKLYFLKIDQVWQSTAQPDGREGDRNKYHLQLMIQLASLLPVRHWLALMLLTVTALKRITIDNDCNQPSLIAGISIASPFGHEPRFGGAG
jgi:hypothetical protein